jgi:hypothetical protein
VLADPTRISSRKQITFSIDLLCPNLLFSRCDRITPPKFAQVLVGNESTEERLIDWLC